MPLFCKGIVHTKMKIIIYSHYYVDSNLYDFLLSNTKEELSTNFLTTLFNIMKANKDKMTKKHHKCILILESYDSDCVTSRLKFMLLYSEKSS